jgi:hypothetical protein
MACLEAQQGNKDEALAQLRRAVDLEPGAASKAAAEDEDFDAIRDDAQFLAITGQATAAGKGS